MSPQLFWIIVLIWTACVVIMCLCLYDMAKGQDKEADHAEAIRDDIVFDHLRQLRKAAWEGTHTLRWQDNARAAEAADNTWDGAA